MASVKALIMAALSVCSMFVPETTARYAVPLDEDLQTYIIELCEEKQIDPAVVFAMIETESGYNIGITGDSGAAIGLMQVQPRWHGDRMARLDCWDLYDPYQNVTVGIDYFAEMLDHYDGDVEKALVAYNAGVMGAEVGWFSKGVYSSEYSRKVLTAAQTISEGAYTDAIQ